MSQKQFKIASGLCQCHVVRAETSQPSKCPESNAYLEVICRQTVNFNEASIENHNFTSYNASNKKAVLSLGGPRDAAVNFDTY